MAKLICITLLLIGIASAVFPQTIDFFYPLRTDWSQSSSQTKISAYIYRDINENGEYDLGDQAFSNIAVLASLDQRTVAATRSNINGFANFPTSTTVEDTDLAIAGEYEFHVIVPPGWRITTDNSIQTRELVEILGSVSGFGMSEALIPIGITRHKFIRGTYSGNEIGTIELLQNDEVIAQAELMPGEEFLWPIERGAYTLVYQNQQRSVIVADNPVDIGQIGDNRNFSDNSGRTIDFEGVAPTGLLKAQNGYGELNWFNLNIMSSNLMDNSVGYINGRTSGNFIIYNSSGHPGKIYSDDPFSLVEVNLTAAWPESEGETVIFQYYRDGAIIYEDRIGLSAYGPITYQPLIDGITEVKITTLHYWQFLMDDLIVSN